MEDITQQLNQLFGQRLLENELLSKHTNFRIGGPARWMVEVRSEEELKAALEIAQANSVPFFVMGGGSNTLASDAGFVGLVLVMGMRKIKIHPSVILRPTAEESRDPSPLAQDDKSVTVEAGAMSAALARATSEAGLQGLEWMISLPGTVGGAIRGNAGCFGGEMKDALKTIRVLRCIPPLPEGGQGGGGACRVIEFSNKDLQFGYRESSIKHSNDIILSVIFELEAGDPALLKTKMDGYLAKRKASQPLYAGSAGCIFKNYEVADEADFAKLKQVANIPEEMLKAKRIGAGWIVDQLDLKGTKIGGAEISRAHGNFIINTGNATATHRSCQNAGQERAWNCPAGGGTISGVRRLTS